MSGDCTLLTSVSLKQRFEATDVKALGTSQLSDSPCYSAWADQFYLENKGKRARAREREHVLTGEGRPALWLLFFCVFSPTSGPACVNWLAESLCNLLSVLPEVVTRVLGVRPSSLLPLFYFCGLFPALSFSHCHSGLRFPMLTAQQEWSSSLPPVHCQEPLSTVL